MLFFFKFGTHYPLYRYETAHFTIQKEMEREKHSSWDNEVG